MSLNLFCFLDLLIELVDGREGDNISAHIFDKGEIYEVFIEIYEEHGIFGDPYNFCFMGEKVDRSQSFLGLV